MALTHENLLIIFEVMFALLISVVCVSIKLSLCFIRKKFDVKIEIK